MDERVAKSVCRSASLYGKMTRESKWRGSSCRIVSVRSDQYNALLANARPQLLTSKLAPRGVRDARNVVANGHCAMGGTIVTQSHRLAILECVLFAATIGCVQNDIKRVIAYSTCSQLGYMFFALGVSYTT